MHIAHCLAGARTLVLVVAAASALAACTSQQTHPSRVTWGDLVEGDRLDAYLESRKEHLEALESKAQALLVRLAERERSLAEVEGALATAQGDARASAAELAAVRKELAAANAQLSATREQAATLQTQIAALRSSLATLTDRRTAQQQIAVKEIQLEKLQGEVELLERAIDRTVLVRARHALQTAGL